MQPSLALRVSLGSVAMKRNLTVESKTLASGIIEQLIRDFKLSTEVATLTIALFVAGYVVG